MFSLPYIVTRLFPNYTPEEQQAIVDVCESGARNFYIRTWKDIQKENLEDPQVQMDMVRTLYDSQNSYSGDIEEVMRSLENWSSGLVAFEFKDKDTNRFYQQWYCFVGFMHFANLERKRQLFLLTSRFIVMAAAWDIPIYANVQAYFARYAYIGLVDEDAYMFSYMLETNDDVMIGDEGKSLYTVADWINIMMTTSVVDADTLVDYFMQTDMRVERLLEDDKKVLYKILTVYYALKTGAIWREIDDGAEVAGFEHKTTEDKKTADEYYLQLLEEANEEQLTIWLSDWREVGLWILNTGKDGDFLNRLFYVLTEKVDLANEKQVMPMLEFIHALQTPITGLELGGDLAYMDEKDGTFHWNKEVVDALKLYVSNPRPVEPEAEEMAETPPAITNPGAAT